MSLLLDKLLSSSSHNFWASGLVFVMVRRHLEFMINGEPIPGTLLLLYSDVVVQDLFWILYVGNLLTIKLCWSCYYMSNYVGQAPGTLFSSLLQDFICQTCCCTLFSNNKFQSIRF
jgi:hypothetical protein